MNFKAVFLIVGLLAPGIAGAMPAPGIQCHLPDDQGPGSLTGSWKQLPIKLVFDEEFYSMKDERTLKAMEHAVRTWNKWAMQKNGTRAFVIKKNGEGKAIPRVSGCSHADYTNAVPEMVGVWKIGKSGKRANQRESCARDANGTLGKILPNVPAQTDWVVSNGEIESASVLLNFDDFNSAGKPRMDVESAFVHELGHVLGLRHSCNGSGPDSVDFTSAPLCSEAPAAYLDAIMAPFEAGMIRRSLGQNDYDRMNCLY